MTRISKIQSLLLLLTAIAVLQAAATDTKHYIVYMGEHSHRDSESVIKSNHEILASVTGSIDAAQRVAIHHYIKSFRGFSARLSKEQAKQLAEHDSVVSVFESRMNKLHTTHSWDFLGLNSTFQYNHVPLASASSDVIVGVIDTGVWPESESFSDTGLGPVPTKFKGSCVPGVNFTSANCNRKIIGARFYFEGYEVQEGPLEAKGRTFFRSARDSDGHGTHTASTVAGSLVPDVSLFGMAKGTARGGAPNARLAIYKACWFGFCSDADVLAAMDDAIDDGVDILSLSLGPGPPQPLYFDNSISIGAFHAFQKGVFVSCSAGNSFLPGTAVNVAPWILTVAASSLDRDFNSIAFLGDSNLRVGLNGVSLNPLTMRNPSGLSYGSDAAAPGVPAVNASFCKNNTLDRNKIEGKIVVCAVSDLLDFPVVKAVVIQQGGGEGMIVIDSFHKGVGFSFTIPSTLIGQEDALQLQQYMQKQKYPVAQIFPTRTAMNTKPAPEMAVFSSQGPNVITPDIIKPDITAPGLNILAAWSPVASSSAAKSPTSFNIISGTSMSCPHVAAVAAIIKSYNPSWSPAAVKSAIMTSATVMDNNGELIGRSPNGTQATPFDYGSGQINPVAALNPGLVYEFDTSDVISFLCSTGANSTQLEHLTGQPTNCQNQTTTIYNFNYPSIGVSNMRGTVSVQRTVTYHGTEPAVFVANVDYPAGVSVRVTPDRLNFKVRGEKQSFKVYFTPLKTTNGSFVFGALTWSSGTLKVRSPIALNVVSL